MTKHEIIGTCAIIVGAILLIYDPCAKRIGEEPNEIADIFCLMVSIPFALYFKLCAMLNQYLPIQDVVLL